ncbi:MAG: phosphoribosylglycinamide formyltransferase [Bacteroidetes bacterium GWE2_29_8]|nr:MAG: phosphoribosylglycinamide formyltransferase [Bacteroidetes bacterium GWE2_29_8]OFY22836.1 MAG: phosphoribosylglycinamide formyltransferase [Bacteroidetes bacterium GWF2_29_10]
MSKKNIAIFASGSGSNAENLIMYFNNTNTAKIKMILTNNHNAYVLERAEKHKIKSNVFSKEELNNTNKIIDLLLENDIDVIILAGFLLKIPQNIIDNYENKIINIHPALLPKYGGKGMYGDNVHKSVLENNENLSGITIHHVNNNYDEGNIIFQATCKVNKDDSIEALAKKIHELEYKFFPLVIDSFLKTL